MNSWIAANSASSDDFVAQIQLSSIVVYVVKQGDGVSDSMQLWHEEHGCSEPSAHSIYI